MVREGRRAFLRGLGASVALPAMPSLAGTAQPGLANAARRAVTSTGAPLRMAFCYLPNGVIMDQGRPEGTGKGLKLKIKRKAQGRRGLTVRNCRSTSQRICPVI